MSHVCPCCDREFDSKRGVNAHKSQKHNRLEPWQDKTTLEHLYVKRRLSSNQIAEILPCNRGNVKRWLRRHGIERRSQSDAAKLKGLRKPPHHRWHNGYEQVVTQINGKQRGVQIHRLIAVAEYGFDAVSDMVVHHRNGVKWDNRPENIELMGRDEHTAHHWENGDFRNEMQSEGMSQCL